MELEKKRKSLKKNQEGIALITAIFALLLATVIGFALYYSSVVASTVAVNERDNTEAFYIAEAGYNHAYSLLSKVQSSDFNTILTAGDGSPGTGDELSISPSSGLWTSAEIIPAGNKDSGGVQNFGATGNGRYWVTVKNDTVTGETPTLDVNKIIVITSTGVGRDGSTTTIEGSITVGSTFPALLVNGNLKLSGNIEIHGLNGIVHANGTLHNNGNPCADLYFSATGNIIDPSGLKGPGCIGVGVARTNQPFITPPVYNIPADFKSKADFVLGGGSGSRGGKVYNKSGVQIGDANTHNQKLWVNGPGSFKWSNSTNRWIQINDIVEGTYYVEGNLEIQGQLGSALFPKRATLIAEGFIKNQGKQYIAPALAGYSLVSGTDISLKGKITTGHSTDDLEAEGLVYAHHQIGFVGSPTIRGKVIAANVADTVSPGSYNLVPLDSGGYMELNGNVTIISNTTSTGNGIKTISWREVRQ